MAESREYISREEELGSINISEEVLAAIAGAAAHNIGQICAAMLVLGGTAVLGYLPALLGVSLVTGALTGFVTSLLFRAMGSINFAQ